MLPRVMQTSEAVPGIEVRAAAAAALAR